MNNMKSSFQPYDDSKILRFHLDSDVCRVDIPVGKFLNNKNLWNEFFCNLELDFDVEYRISLVFIGDNDNVYPTNESFVFGSSYFFDGEVDFSDFLEYVKEWRGKIQSACGYNCSVVDVIFSEDVNESE